MPELFALLPIVVYLGFRLIHRILCEWAALDRLYARTQSLPLPAPALRLRLVSLDQETQGINPSRRANGVEADKGRVRPDQSEK